MTAWIGQVGGTHYKDMMIQPMEYSMANKLNALQHTIIKYVSRYKDKGGVDDLEKAKHCVEMLIDYEMRHREAQARSESSSTTLPWAPKEPKDPMGYVSEWEEKEKQKEKEHRLPHKDYVSTWEPKA